MALPDPPPGLDLQATRVPELFSALIITWVFALIAVVLRFLARRLMKNPIWREDWLVLGALITATVHVYTTNIYMVGHGFGRHIWAGPPDAAKVWAIGLFISEIAYTLTIIGVKYSSLSFYWRIFSADKTIRLPIWALLGVVTSWGIAVLLITFLQCFPLNAFWERLDPVHPLPPSEFSCGVDSNKFFLGNSIPNIITDAFIVLLPLPYVWRLKLRTTQRLALGGIFVLGIFVTIISGIRLMFIRRVNVADPDITWAFSDTVIWTNAEGNLAIVGCSLPSLKPILDLTMTRFTNTINGSTNNTNSSATGHSSKGGLPSYMSSNTHTSISKGSEERGPFRRLSETDSRSESGIQLSDVTHDGITITKHIRVHSAQFRSQSEI